MLRPKLSVFDEIGAQKIISEGMALLIDPGVRVHNREGLQLLAEAGAEVDFSAQIAKIPEGMVRAALETTPQEFYLYDISGEPRIHYGGDDIHFDPGSAGISVLNTATNRQSSPQSADFVRWVKLVETIPQVDAQSTSMVCSDVPVEIGDLYRLYLALLYMQKPIITGAFGIKTWWIMRDMLMTVRGGERELADKPLAVFDVCPSPPLLWSDLTCQNLIDCARAGIPAELVSMPLSGATSPVTLAAAVVQHTAESLSGIVIHQLAKPGSPIVWGGSPAAFDMREGTTPMGAAETWLIDAGYVQIGKALGLPTHVYMGMSDAKILDAQCGLESMGGALTAALIGANMISGAGMLDFETCLSFEKLVIDAEIIGLVKRMARGIQFHEDPIALTVMRQMGHRADYLAMSHTRKWFRKELYIPSEVIDRGSYDAWQQKGTKSVVDRARERVDQLLMGYQGNSLSAELRRELKEITLSVARHYGMNQLPVIEVESFTS